MIYSVGRALFLGIMSLRFFLIPSLKITSASLYPPVKTLAHFSDVTSYEVQF